MSAVLASMTSPPPVGPMPLPDEWDQATPNGVAYKALPVLVADMTGDVCNAAHEDAWGHLHLCWRANGHTGRHLGLERLGRYPTAVWRD